MPPYQARFSITALIAQLKGGGLILTPVEAAWRIWRTITGEAKEPHKGMSVYQACYGVKGVERTGSFVSCGILRAISKKRSETPLSPSHKVHICSLARFFKVRVALFRTHSD